MLDFRKCRDINITVIIFDHNMWFGAHYVRSTDLVQQLSVRKDLTSLLNQKKIIINILLERQR